MLRKYSTFFKVKSLDTAFFNDKTGCFRDNEDFGTFNRFPNRWNSELVNEKAKQFENGNFGRKHVKHS